MSISCRGAASSSRSVLRSLFRPSGLPGALPARSFSSSQRAAEKTKAADGSDASDPTSSSPASDSLPSTSSSSASSAPREQRGSRVDAALDLSSVFNFPDLARPDPILDAPNASIRTASAITLNSPAHFAPTPPHVSAIETTGEETDPVPYLSAVTPLSVNEIRNLYRFPLVIKRVVNMTGKGKQPSMYALVVVGNGKGMVGYGEGKHELAGNAANKAFNDAVKNMDFVDRFQNRTVWGTVEGKYGATRIVLRSRPPGFGLRTNPYIHQVLKAAGITDCSAKVYGSRNGMNIVKATMQLLWGGSSPLGMGDGVGGKAARRNKGVGMRTKADVEIMRGRRLREVPVGKGMSA